MSKHLSWFMFPSIAPGSASIYTGAAFPQWQGNLLIGALAKTHINMISLTQIIRLKKKFVWLKIEMKGCEILLSMDKV